MVPVARQVKLTANNSPWITHELCYFQIKQIIYCCDRKAWAACAQSFALLKKATIEFTCRDHSLVACSCHIYCIYCSSHTFRLWWTTHSAQCQRRGCNNIPSFLQRTAPIACSFCEGFTRHDLHILVTAPFCCNRKAWVACAWSFVLWQQATIEFTCRGHSIIACSHHIYMVLFFVHIPFVVDHTFSAIPTERLQQYQAEFQENG